MISVHLTLSNPPVCIGYKGENVHTEIRFDAAEVFAEYPDATTKMVVRNPKGILYPVELTRDEGDLVWLVTRSDLAAAGSGRYQISFLDGEEVFKTCIGTIIIQNSLDGEEGDVPDPIETWIEKADAILDEAQEDIERAEGLIDATLESAEKAEGYAVGQKDGEDVDPESPYHQNNAKYYSEQAGSAKTAAVQAKEAAASAAEEANQSKTAAEKSAGDAAGAKDAAADAQGKAEAAQGKAETAQEKAETAQSKAETAQEKAETAQSKAEAAQRSAGQAAEAAEGAAGDASQSASAAGSSELKAEGYAVGKQDGTDVESGSPYYQNNAKYYKEQAALSEGKAKEYRDSAHEIAQNIETAGTEQVQAINRAGTTQTQAVNQAGTTKVQEVNQAGTAQVQSVNQAGANQVSAVNTKGQEVLDSIPDDYSDLTQEVSDLNRAINNGYTNANVIANGSCSSSGLTTGATNRIRTGLIPFKAGDKIVIKNGTLQHACGMWQDSVSSANIKREDDSFSSTTETISPGFDGFLVVVFRFSTNANLSPSDFDGEIQVYNSLIWENNIDMEALSHIIVDGFVSIEKYINGSYTNALSPTPTLTNNNRNRLRPENFIYVKAGDRIKVNNGTGHVHTVGIWKGAIGSATSVREDSNFVSSDETVLIGDDGFAIVLFANTNTSTYINAGDFDGSILISTYVSAIDSCVKQGRNLISSELNQLCPISVNSGDYLTMSTSDGLPIGLNPTQTNISFYDENGTFIDYYGFIKASAKRTIGPLPSTLDSAKYVAISGCNPRIPIMLNFGKTALPYEAYIMPFGYMSDKVLSMEYPNVIKIHKNDKAKVNALIKSLSSSGSPTRNSIGVMWITDIHKRRTAVERMVQLVDSWGTTLIDIGINTGDTVQTIQTEGVDWYDELIEHSSIPILNTVGNHDAWTNISTHALASSVDVYQMITKEVAEQTEIVQPQNAESLGLNYYYKDINGIRIIVLDCMYWDADQLAWFESALADAITQSYPVIACIHYPFYKDYRTYIDTIWDNGISKASSESTSADISAAVAVNTFMNNGGKFVCWLQGHSHQDAIYTLNDYGDQLCIQTASATNQETLVYKSDDTNDYNYDALTFVTVDESRSQVKFYRIGANINASGQIANAFVWDYAEKAMVCDW